MGECRNLDQCLFKKTIDVNLMGVVNGSLSAYRIMAGQGYGQIVNISSVSGLIGSPLFAPYSTAKHGVVGFSKALREEGRSLGVKVSVVCPGNIKTDFIESGYFSDGGKNFFVKGATSGSITVEGAAKRILKEISRNRGVIVFPLFARFLHLLERLNPSFLTPFHQRVITNYRGEKPNSH